MIPILIGLKLLNHLNKENGSMFKEMIHYFSNEGKR
ncbi:hypothetical protein BN983_02819 [Halobacillus karajensis]|uniref:Uncharacterized protein n=1 Tax=Halobacillus karajensis TaxID=195088 RepID=A0A024P851_9BACI|nr:hypothetical protein BN983_02819 [Halobacillus karajensis]